MADIANADFAIWYQNIIEEMDKYAGKVIRFTALPAVCRRMPASCFLSGRPVMTCGAEDIAYSAPV